MRGEGGKVRGEGGGGVEVYMLCHASVGMCVNSTVTALGYHGNSHSF